MTTELTLDEFYIDLSDFKEMMVDISDVMSLIQSSHDPSLYTEDPPVIETTIEESPLICTFSKYQKRNKIHLDAQTRKLLSNIVYTKLKQFVSNHTLKNNFKHNVKELNFRSTRKLLYPY